MQLLSYVRHILKNKQKKTMALRVGHNSTSDFFSFSVNGNEIKDYIAKDTIDID